MLLPIIVHASPACAFGSLEGVLIASWRTEIQMQDVRELVAYRDELVAHGMRGAVHMAEPALALPSPEVRRETTRAVAVRGDLRPPIALVTLSTGFAASAMRAAGTAMFSLRSGPPTRVFGDARSACHWLVVKGAIPVDALALHRACEALRQAGLGSERSGVHTAPEPASTRTRTR